MTFQKLCGLSLLMTAISLSGCSSMKGKSGGEAPDSGTTPSTPATAKAQPGLGEADPRGGLVVEHDAADAAAARTAAGRAEKAGLVAAERVLQFDFDSADLSAENRDRLKRHAAFLAADKGAKARLEGHTDERGTQEYNMALGERRARAVAIYLQSLGVSASRLEVISYGETKPVAEGEDEAAWAANRRVEVSYR
jgi:peptidoglycan-associated lipoprotein